MQYDDRFTQLANRDIRNYWNFLSECNAKAEDYRYQLWNNVDPFAFCDCLQRKQDVDGDFTEQNIELKGRDVELTAYPDCLVDLHKIQKLQKIAYQSGNKTYLVALYYPSSKLAMWEIDPEEQYDIIIKKTNIYTAAPEQGKREKQMVSLPLSKARIYSFSVV